tara:strand:+ start:24316 stop:24447 length:132 start_codon:yes stop_codon:yes gene_type:complete
MGKKPKIIALPNLHGNIAKQTFAAAGVPSWDFIGSYMLAALCL